MYRSVQWQIQVLSSVLMEFKMASLSFLSFFSECIFFTKQCMMFLSLLHFPSSHPFRVPRGKFSFHRGASHGRK